MDSTTLKQGLPTHSSICQKRKTTRHSRSKWQSPLPLFSSSPSACSSQPWSSMQAMAAITGWASFRPRPAARVPLQSAWLKMSLRWTLRSTGVSWPPQSTSAMELCRGTLCHALRGVLPTTTASPAHRRTPTTVAAVPSLAAVVDEASLECYTDVHDLDHCVWILSSGVPSVFMFYLYLKYSFILYINEREWKYAGLPLKCSK